MYELFEHTADLGLRARAADLGMLFSEMGACLSSAMIEDIASVQPGVEVRIELSGFDREYLLFDWLRELLLRFEADRLLFSQFEATVRTDGLSGIARGEPYDPARHALSREVKAITYHELKVERDDNGWLAEVIVDI
jgi:SHS2 domain-containing protein